MAIKLKTFQTSMAKNSIFLAKTIASNFPEFSYMFSQGFPGEQKNCTASDFVHEILRIQRIFIRYWAQLLNGRWTRTRRPPLYKYFKYEQQIHKTRREYPESHKKWDHPKKCLGNPSIQFQQIYLFTLCTSKKVLSF